MFARIKIPAILLVACLGVPAFAGPLQHNYDLKNVLWKIAFDEKARTISGDVTNTLTLSSPSDTVQLHAGDLQIGTVTVDGLPAKFDYTNNILTVHLSGMTARGTTLKVETIYTGSPQRGLYFVDPENAFPSKTGMVYSQGEGEDNHYWLPTYDLPDDKATTECYITTPKTWTAISNGKLMDVTPQGDQKVFHWKMDQPFSTYLISIVAGEYVEGVGSWRHVPVSYFVPPGLEETGRIAFGNTPKMIDFYSHLTGVDYPYPKFAQDVVGDFMYGGMENITAVTQMIRTLHQVTTEPLNDSTGLVAHELAHQWFGDLITCQTWEHMWLNEGFATYLPLYLDRAWRGQEVFDIDRQSTFETAIDTMGSRGRKAIDEPIGHVPTVSMGSAYAGGASRMFMLSHKLGEKTFWKGIQAFLTQYGFKPATTNDFFAVMSKVSGQNLDAFQSQWFHTVATPSLALSVDGDDVVVSQLAPYYNLDLPLWVLHNDRWVKKSIHLEGAEARLKLGALASDPILLDPEVWTLMEFDDRQNLSPAQITALYHRAPNAAQRARIISTLFKRMPVEARAAIVADEATPGLLSLMASHLGAEGSEAILGLTWRLDVGVVNAAVVALGNIAQSPKVVERLKDLANDHPNEVLREHALRSILNQTTDPSFAADAWSRPSFDDGFRVMAMGWWAKHAPDTAREHALAALAKRDTLPVRVAACQALAVVKEAGDSHAVYDALVDEASRNSFGPRVAAIRALGSLGNTAAIPFLEKIPASSTGGVLGATTDALRALRHS